MPTLLHRPVADAAGVAALAARGAEETDQLEFKRDGGDLVKEAAALANAAGGDVILGAATTRDPTTNRDRWVRWVATTPFNEKNAGQDLRDHLSPSEVADTIRLTPLLINQEGTDYSVLIATVPPWPYGPVAWKSEVNVQQAHFRFPKRFGAQTRYMSLEEIMRTNDGRKRSTYLALRQLFDEMIGGNTPREVSFRLQTGISASPWSFEPLPADAPDGVILDVGPDLLRLRLAARSIVQATGQQGGVPTVLTDDVAPLELAVPLELVLAAWRPAPASYVAALALTVPLLWDRDRWRFNFTRSWGGG
jgi:hypothetical protein